MTSGESESRSRRDGLVAAILAFLGGPDLLSLPDVRAALEQEIDAAGPEAVVALKARLASDAGWDYSPPDLLARRVHHLLADRFLAPDSSVRNAHHLAGVASMPVVIVANHLSYADANVLQVLLRRAGGAELADRLTALAGPKVFTDRERRFSSLCFGTVKVPQSTDVSSGEAVLGARDVARAARHAIEVALARLRAGDALVLFGEGTRSRSGEMQMMLPGTARYLEGPATFVLPVGLTGPERLFPVDGRLQPARITIEIGTPIHASSLLEHADGDRRLVVDAIGLAIAALLPSGYRGVYGRPDAWAEAGRVLRRVTDAT